MKKRGIQHNKAQRKNSKRISSFGTDNKANKITKVNLSKFNLGNIKLIGDTKSKMNEMLKSLAANLRMARPVPSFSWRSPKIIAAALTVLVTFSIGVIYYNQTAAATYVVINGEKVGVVKTEAAGQEIVQKVLQERGQAVNTLAKTHDQVEYINTRVKKGEFWDKSLTKDKLESKLSSYLDGYKLVIANESLAILPSKEAIDKVLKEYQDYYTKPSEANKISSVQLVESINSEAVEVQPQDVKTAEEVLKLLTEGKSSVMEYTVEESDSWWLIARKNDMKTKEVLAGNPGATEDTVLQPGQKIKLVTVTPYLTVMSKGMFTGTETIPFDVVTKTDTSVAAGQSKVVQQGSDGAKEVTYSYEQKNGKDVSKTVIDEKVLKPSVTQIVAKGPARQTTVAYASSRGSGQIGGLNWPLRGHISSYYGYRSRGFHTGLDIEGDTGDPYTAAAAGTVSSAGWSGGYGKMILIDHGNGVMTRYAHSSKLLVQVGQKVSQGETIGLVGTTGNTTGPHLHFEIIINGDTVNPLKYLR